jgi:hypothetical protein
MNNNYYQSAKSSWLMKMFWKAAGADQYLLERSTYSDQVKYFCLGGIVVATGVMAALAGGYAFYTIFAPKDPVNGDLLFSISDVISSSIFGIIWGLIIFNIDRFIVASTGKGDGTEAITKQEILNAIPRIIMGIIIALTISKPIEIRMFQTEIQTELTKQKDSIKLKNKKTYEEKYQEGIDKKEKEINAINSKIDKAEQHYLKLDQDINDLVAGIGKYTGKPCNIGKNCPKHSQLYLSKDNAKINWDKLKIEQSKNLNRLNKEKDQIIIERDQKIKDLDIIEEGLNGLGVRIRLISNPKVAGPWISLFITLLFMVIELTPIFFKMMLIKGPYDYMDDNIKDLAKAESGIEVEYNFYKDKEGMEAHKVTNHAAELKKKEKLLIIKAQEELNEKIILNWKTEKLKDIDDNPDKYISEK